MTRATSPTANATVAIAGLLLALMLTSWLTGIRSHLIEWISQNEDTTSTAAPNILLIVADDLGYNDSTLINAGGIATPNLNDLAARGVTFTRHYADATCTPSRVALLSGNYPERSGFRPIGIEIPKEYPTIAERLQKAGYATYLTGKWHAGEDRNISGPEHKGFGNWFGFLNQWELSGAVIDANKGGAKRPTYHDPMLRTNGGPLVAHKGHLTDILTEHTIEKIKTLQTSEKPWFVYHAFLAPHHPIQPAPRFRTQFPDTPEGEYLALVTQMDDAVGKILDAVDTSNTLVIFLSDNGGTNKQRDNNFPFNGKKGETSEGAYRTPLVISWPGMTPEGTIVDDIAMNVDIYPTIMVAAGITDLPPVDGTNLWPSITAGASLAPRERGWEVYSENVGTMNFSYLSRTGQWRLASAQGVATSLFDLSNEPSGKTDIAAASTEAVEQLTRDFWRDHWQKSVLPVEEQRSESANTRYYSGLDAMRAPFRYGLSIGLELGPLPNNSTSESHATAITLAGQPDIWELLYVPNHGLEWRIGNKILRDASFNPEKCNAVVLTNYFQPMAHLAVREPRSQLKLYSAGLLRDYDYQFDYATVSSENLEVPTFVNHDGRAMFANMMASAFSDPYQPRIKEQFLDIYTKLYKERNLSIVDVHLMTKQLCNKPENQ